MKISCASAEGFIYKNSIFMFLYIHMLFNRAHQRISVDADWKGYLRTLKKKKKQTFFYYLIKYRKFPWISVFTVECFVQHLGVDHVSVFGSCRQTLLLLLQAARPERVSPSSASASAPWGHTAALYPPLSTSLLLLLPLLPPPGLMTFSNCCREWNIKHRKLYD